MKDGVVSEDLASEPADIQSPTGRDLPEWIEVKLAVEYFGSSTASINRLIHNKKIISRADDPSRVCSHTNRRLVHKPSLENYLIQRGSHPDAWPDPAVQNIADPLPVMYPTEHLRRDQIGNVGEHLVAYYLTFAGASVSLVDRRGMDHFVRMPNGSMFALEVKTRSTPDQDQGKKALHSHFKTSRLDADWFAFLDLSTNVVLFRRLGSTSTQKSSEAIPHKFFTPFYMNQSLQNLFHHYGAEPDPLPVEKAA